MSRPEDQGKKGQSPEKRGVMIEIDPTPKGEWKVLGGSDRDEWNKRLSTLVVDALPVDQKNANALSYAGSAVMAGVVDMKPADPVEGVLISQIVVANEAALSLYRRAWACDPGDYFEAHTRFLQLAEKFSRTVATLTERLDRHRGGGQQQVTVKHVTVNAGQAVVADQIVTDKQKETVATNLLVAGTNKPMEIVEPTQKEPVSVEGGRSRNERQPHAQCSRRSSMHSEIKANRPALSRARGTGLQRLPDARRSRWCARGQTERKL
jgi:hypothetical protein